jgi:hypothetical protein
VLHLLPPGVLLPSIARFSRCVVHDGIKELCHSHGRFQSTGESCVRQIAASIFEVFDRRLEVRINSQEHLAVSASLLSILGWKNQELQFLRRHDRLGLQSFLRERLLITRGNTKSSSIETQWQLTQQISAIPQSLLRNEEFVINLQCHCGFS